MFTVISDDFVQTSLNEVDKKIKCNKSCEKEFTYIHTFSCMYETIIYELIVIVLIIVEFSIYL